MGFNIHILSGRNRSTNRAGHAALAASFNPVPDSMQKQDALVVTLRLTLASGGWTKLQLLNGHPSQLVCACIDLPQKSGYNHRQNTLRT
jgi:hypothetical protein